jgi:hypothetical protein
MITKTKKTGIRLATPPKFHHRAKVTMSVFGTFPIDMLRYDQCYPGDQPAASVIAAASQTIHNLEAHQTLDTIEILVNKHSWSPDFEQAFTIARWESFGCKIEPIDR